MPLCILCLLLFTSGLLAQVIWWRIRVPAHPTTALLRLFSVWLVVGIACLGWTGYANSWGLLGWFDYGRLLVFYVPMVLAYVCFYSSIDVESPSIMMLELTREAHDQGCHQTDYRRVVNDDLLVGSRIHGMVNGGLATLEGDSLQLTPKGRIFAELFRHSYRLLALRDGG